MPRATIDISQHHTDYISRLPNELLYAVISSLPPGRHIAKVALVSRRFNDVSTPILYRNITIQASAAGLSPMPRLIETLTDKPRLRQYVNTLRVKEPIIAPGGVYDLLELTSEIRNLWLEPLLPAVSFRKFEKLEALRFSFEDYVEADIFHDITPEEPPETIARCFNMSGLRRLFCDHFPPYHHNPARLFPPAQYRTSPITELHLTGAKHCGVGILPQILLAIRVLKSLTLDVCLTWGRNQGVNRGFEPTFPTSLAQAIEPHADTLEALCIAGSEATRLKTVDRMVSIASYSHLKKLAIPERFLLGHEGRTFHELLPSGLEELQLQHRSDDAEAERRRRWVSLQRLDAFADMKRDCLPSLRRLIWWGQTTSGTSVPESRRLDFLPETRACLQAKFREVGVWFDTVTAVSFNETPFGQELRFWGEGDP